MKPSFTENQRFTQWWLYVLLAIPFLAVSLSFIIDRTDAGQTSGRFSPHVLFFMFLPLSFILWFAIIRLKTTIDEHGITAHFFFIPFCKKKFNWSEIKSVEVIEYSPLLSYGGWGVRYSAAGWCYNVSGNIGIKLVDNHDVPFLIGTQKKEAAENTIAYYFNK